MDSKEQIHTSAITSVGYKARDNNNILDSLELEGQNVRGQCIEITRYIVEKFINRYQIPSDMTGSVRCYLMDNEIHYLVYLNLRCVENLDKSKGKLYIDASIDQFCDEQSEYLNVSLGSYKNLPRIDILTPSDSRRNRYGDITYDVLRKPD